LRLPKSEVLAVKTDTKVVEREAPEIPKISETPGKPPEKVSTAVTECTSCKRKREILDSPSMENSPEAKDTSDNSPIKRQKINGEHSSNHQESTSDNNEDETAVYFEKQLDLFKKQAIEQYKKLCASHSKALDDVKKYRSETDTLHHQLEKRDFQIQVLETERTRAKESTSHSSKQEREITYLQRLLEERSKKSTEYEHRYTQSENTKTQLLAELKHAKEYSQQQQTQLLQTQDRATQLQLQLNQIAQTNERLREEIRNGKVCTLCLKNPKNALMQPCNHLMTCMGCSANIYSKRKKEERVCPYCRSPIQSIVLCHLWGDNEEESQRNTQSSID